MRLALIGLFMVFNSRTGVFGEEYQGTTEKVIAWGNTGKGWGTWGASGEFMYAASVSPTVLEVWQWSGGAMQKRCSVPIDDSVLSIAILPNGRSLYKALGEQRRPADFYIGDLQSGRVIDSWQVPHGLYIKLANGSRNGKFVTAWCEREPGEPGPRNEVRFGLVASDGLSFDWVTSLTAPRLIAPQSMIHRVVPSEDGTHIGVAGWDGGVAMIDVTKKATIWTQTPGKLAPEDLAFTPDGGLIYTGGAQGCVHGVRVQDGQAVSAWWATSTGQEVYGQRITTISASPDGRFVAAGTGPEGDVYVFSTKDGQRHVLNHGGSTILMTSFSPDSKRLASYAAGQIKIWKLPEVQESTRSSR